MSDAASPPRKGLGYVNVTSKWGWFVALGIVLILVGLFALIDVVAFTIASVIFIGAMPVSYTHLTLPTKRIVYLSVVGG